MKRMNAVVAALAALLFFGFAIGAGSGCGHGHTVKLAAGPQLPAAHGEVKVKEGKNNDTYLRLVVHNVLRPEQLAPNASALVVWAKATAPGGEPQNIGILQLDDNMDGKLDTMTPFIDFDLMVTAEPTMTASSPSGAPIFTTHVNRFEGSR